MSESLWPPSALFVHREQQRDKTRGVSVSVRPYSMVGTNATDRHQSILQRMDAIYRRRWTDQLLQLNGQFPHTQKQVGAN